MTLRHKLAAGLAVFAFSALTMAQTIVGVSWSNFQEERWKTDEKAIKTSSPSSAALRRQRRRRRSPEKQLADIDGLIAKGREGADHPGDGQDAIIPALAKAKAKNIPVVAYDRLIEAPGVFYITFDNKAVGRMQARAILVRQAQGQLGDDQGSPTDPNADFLRARQQEVLAESIKKGDIRIVGEEHRRLEAGGRAEDMSRSRPRTRTRSTRSSRPTTAWLAASSPALSGRGIKGVPVSGQDGDHAALNRVALGTQTVSVWKDSRDLGREAATAAMALASAARRSRARWSGPKATKKVRWTRSSSSRCR